MTDINAYLLQLATEHNAFLHTTAKPAFFKERSASRVLLDNTELLAKMERAAAYVLIAQFNDDGEFDGPNLDTQYDTSTGTIYILGRTKGPEDYTGQDTVRNNAKTYMRQIIARIRKDSQEGALPKQFVPGRVWRTSLGMVGDNYYGTAFHIEFTEPVRFNYDQEQWTLA